MDIEEYLRQKRELEAKKEVLEAKERVDQDKDRVKKEQRAKIYADYGVKPQHHPSPSSEPETHSQHHYKMPSAGPGAWNTILLLLILVLLVVSYFIPRYGEEQIRDIVSQEKGSKNIREREQPLIDDEEEDDEEEKKIVQKQEQNKTDEKKQDAPKGPLIALTAKDTEEGVFDDDGKLDGEILVVNIESGLKYYDDFEITLTNKESEPILCKIDREVEIDTNFDGKSDMKDTDLDRFKIEIDPKWTEYIKSDVVPGSVETGTYEGKGDITTTYEARCYFCLDRDCNSINDKAVSRQETFFRVWINKDLGDKTTNTTTNRTNQSR